MPTLSFHSLELLLIAYQARNRALTDAQRPNALTTDSIVAVVMAAASTEGFINEFAEHIAISRAAASDYLRESVTPAMAACADAIAELEDSKAQVTAKYLIASLALSGAAFSRDAAPFQDFATLIRLRNAIMHARPVTSEESHQGTKITDALAQRGIAWRIEPPANFSWFNRLEVPAVARWACEAARGIILATLELVPPRGIELGDPISSLRNGFGAHVGFREPDT